MKRKITLLVATAVVASTMGAAPAGASPSATGHAKKCGQESGDRAEIRCCIKKAKSEQEERKCIKRNLD